MCKADHCVLAGTFDNFGSLMNVSMENVDDPFPVKVEVTKTVRDLGLEPGDKTIKLRISNIVDLNGHQLPEQLFQPVVIHRGANSARDTVRLHVPLDRAGWTNMFPPALFQEKPFDAEVIVVNDSTVIQEIKLDVTTSPTEFNILGVKILLGQGESTYIFPND